MAPKDSRVVVMGSAMSPGRRNRPLLLLGIVGFLLAWLPVLPRRRFDPDEFEHAHAAWCVFRGTVPYRDFFEHHTPWYYYVLRPLFHWFTVDASLDSAMAFLLTGRILSLLLTGASLVLVIAIGRRWTRRRENEASVGPLAALLLVSQPVFFQKIVEMRPDVPALVLFLGALALLLRALAEPAAPTDVPPSAPRRWPWFIGAGLCQGGAIMCTQKMLFALPGLCVGLALWALLGGDHQPGGRRRMGRVLAMVAFGAAVAVPCVLTWALFAARGAGAAFITNNFLLNAQWRPMATNQGSKFLLTSGPALALALAGAGAWAWRYRRSQPRDAAGLVLLCTAAGLFAGVLVMPVAQRQYYLMPLPIVCLFAARGLLLLVERIMHPVRTGRRAWAVVGLAVGLAVSLAALPVLALRAAYRDSNTEQLARLGDVYQRTAPTDVVMDGWEGMGVFRPHAFYYFFLHAEAVAMLPAPRLDAYLDQLESGAVRPQLIAMDKNLASLGARFVTFVQRNYASRDGFLYDRQTP